MAGCYCMGKAPDCTCDSSCRCTCTCISKDKGFELPENIQQSIENITKEFFKRPPNCS